MRIHSVMAISRKRTIMNTARQPIAEGALLRTLAARRHADVARRADVGHRRVADAQELRPLLVRIPIG